MRNYGIIWPAWPASRVVSLVAHRHSAVPSVYSLSVTTAGNFTNNIFHIIRLILWTSLAHYISHSVIYMRVCQISKSGMIDVLGIQFSTQQSIVLSSS